MNQISTNDEMAYFINPSLNLEDKEKEMAYIEASKAIKLVLEGENNMIVKMSTINCLLKTHLPYFYWVGFYCVNGSKLTVGPYQGTLGCIHIDIGKGVCGQSAAKKETLIVQDVSVLEEGEDHITCDPNSQSEIVVPVLDHQGELLAVFDVDSTLKNSFNEIDQLYLEQIINEQFSTQSLVKHY
ncbi:MAG: GAF domain-containing protein [Bacteroidota bacterium]